MSERLSLVHYDMLRELCGRCRRERFHFVPIGAPAATGKCKQCGDDAKLADVSDSSIYRLFTEESGELVIVPMIAKSA